MWRCPVRYCRSPFRTSFCHALRGFWKTVSFLFFFLPPTAPRPSYFFIKIELKNGMNIVDQKLCRYKLYIYILLVDTFVRNDHVHEHLLFIHTLIHIHVMILLALKIEPVAYKKRKSGTSVVINKKYLISFSLPSSSHPSCSPYNKLPWCAVTLQRDTYGTVQCGGQHEWLLFKYVDIYLFTLTHTHTHSLSFSCIVSRSVTRDDITYCMQ